MTRQPLLVLAAAVSALGLSPAPAPAVADSVPPGSTPATVTADPLPTVQIDGVAWSQVLVGTTVFVGGNFTTARPAGAPPGANTVPRQNFLAYDVRTGQLLPDVDVRFNAQVLALNASPDGKRIYAVGDFTAVNGVTRNRIVAISTANGRVIRSFQAGTWSRISAVAARSDRVYVGGSFTATDKGVPRRGLAAFSASDGALMGWRPAIGGPSARVNALTVTPSRTKVIAGGSFATVNGISRPGLAAIDHATGNLTPWAVGTVVQNSGPNAAILSLSADETSVYGAGYVRGTTTTGNLEGAFRADGDTGTIRWIADCKGDTYSVHPAGPAVYTAGHAHACGNLGGFPRTDPETYHRAIAFSEQATGTNADVMDSYNDFAGLPAPSLLHWYPRVTAGTFTGLVQGAWSIAGNDRYVIMAGEFPQINGVAQQGLARFAVSSVAPNRQGPVRRGAAFVPTVRELPNGGVAGSVTGNWDADNEQLRYRVVRDGSVVVQDVTRLSPPGQSPTIGFVDTAVTLGETYTYRVEATDPFGNTALSDPASVTVTRQPNVTPYARAVLATGASLYWRLGGQGTGFTDWAGSLHGTPAGIIATTPGALIGDPDPASEFGPAASAFTTTPTRAPQAFSVTAWFRTTSTRGGRIVGFGPRMDGNSWHNDRHLYLDNAGHLLFGVRSGTKAVLRSRARLNDGAWHYVAATLGPNTGAVLYVDGTKVAANRAIRSGHAYDGYWRVGAGQLDGWPDRPTDPGLAGTLDEVATYGHVLSPTAIARQVQLAGRTVRPSQPPVAQFTATPTNLRVQLDASATTAGDGAIRSYRWEFGDNTSSWGRAITHTYPRAGTYSVRLTVTDDLGAIGVRERVVRVTAP